jgi:signal transduction histidine kinase
LKNLRERMRAAGGMLEIESAAVGGTRVRCVVPVLPA